MLKTLLAATTALTLMSGIGFAETSYSSSTTESTAGAPSHNVDITKSTQKTTNPDGVVIEKHQTVSKDFDHDRTMAEKDRTVTKDTDVSADGTVSRKKTETTTIR